MDSAMLESYLRRGLSLEAIGRLTGRHPSTIGYWIKRHGLAAVNRDRHAPKGGIERDTLAAFGGRGEAVARRRRRLLVADAGGRCSVCGYDRYIGALQFHHRDGKAKSFGLADRGLTRSLEAVRAEAAKCVLLCANCHSEVEAGIVRAA